MVVNKFLKVNRLESIWGYIFILPAIFIISIFTIYPALGSIYYSFFKYNGIKTAEFIGIGNYIKFFIDDPLALNSLKLLCTIFLVLYHLP